MNLRSILAKIDETVTPPIEMILFGGMVALALFGMKGWFLAVALVYFAGSGFAGRIWGMIQDAQDNG